jgi:hypothetical protein
VIHPYLSDPKPDLVLDLINGLIGGSTPSLVKDATTRKDDFLLSL